MIDRLYTTSETGWEWNVDVRNAGQATAAASSTGLKRSCCLDELLIATPQLAPGESVTVTAECPQGSMAQATARADATNVVPEMDEDNNQRASVPGEGVDGRCRYP